jgi:hypothetical protein
MKPGKAACSNAAQLPDHDSSDNVYTPTRPLRRHDNGSEQQGGDDYRCNERREYAAPGILLVCLVRSTVRKVRRAESINMYSST